MKAFVWSQIFETGIAEVDAQHRRLVELVNDLGEEIDRGDSRKLDFVLQELAQYTVYHFGSERTATLWSRCRSGLRRAMKTVS